MRKSQIETLLRMNAELVKELALLTKQSINLLKLVTVSVNNLQDRMVSIEKFNSVSKN